MSPIDAALPPVPALPEPVGNEEEEVGGFKQDDDHADFKQQDDQSDFKQEDDQNDLHVQHQIVSVDAVAIAIDHATAALAGGGVDVDVDHHGDHTTLTMEDPEDPMNTSLIQNPKKRNKKLPLSYHEALTFASRGIYVDIESNQLRCSCNHKVCDKWDAYGYSRHFGFKCHKKYEDERLDDVEINRLREAKETYVRIHPVVEEVSIRKKRKMKDGEKILSVDELRVQERHWMEMWKDAKNELKQLRQDLKDELDEEVRAELVEDINGLRRRKGDWAKLLGLNDHVTTDVAVNM